MTPRIVDDTDTPETEPADKPAIDSRPLAMAEVNNALRGAL